jgi:hypothetical protein
MTRYSGITLMLCALVLAALTGAGQAGEATLQANAAIQGEGRFYRATADMIAFVGYYQGAINVTNQKGDLIVNAASLTCPGILEVNTATKTTEGAGRCLFLTQDGTHVYGSWTCTGKPGAGCGGTFKVLGGTGRFDNASGQGEFMMASTLAEMDATIPKEGQAGEPSVTGKFTGKVEWPELKVTTK